MKKLSFLQEADKREKAIRQHREAHKVKDRLNKLGFNLTLSLYGLLKERESLKRTYRRIEIFLKEPPTRKDLQNIEWFFSRFKPAAYHSIWCYNGAKGQIKLIRCWD